MVTVYTIKLVLLNEASTVFRKMSELKYENQIEQNSFGSNYTACIDLRQLISYYCPDPCRGLREILSVHYGRCLRTRLCGGQCDSVQY